MKVGKEKGNDLKRIVLSNNRSKKVKLNEVRVIDIKGRERTYMK